MKRISERIRKKLPGAQVTQTAARPENTLYKLVIRAGGVQTKIEVTPVLRGCVYEPELRAVSRSAEDTFGKLAEETERAACIGMWTNS
jgi:hypothetical protein